MAEFKLGRIRFVWKGNWTATTRYYKDDVVRQGGNTFVCIIGHNSTTYFENDQEAYWNKISDGQQWRGNWSTSTHYAVNDLVKYGGNIYICIDAHTSADTETAGLENDIANWEEFATSFDYKSDWTTGTKYKINDLVRYSGIIYVCIESHISSVTETDGLEADQAKWETFTAGVNYKADWNPTTRYRVNDLVKYGGSIWICIQHHTSQGSFVDDESKWNQFVDGLEFEDSWRANINYQPGDFVTYGGYSYIAKTFNQGSKPSEVLDDWDLFSTGFRWAGEYAEDSSDQDYLTGDVVRLNGYTYLCVKTHNGFPPPNETYWAQLNSGLDWKGEWTDATIYQLGDLIRYDVNSYICIQTHTSDEVIAQNRPDQDLVGNFWNLIAAGPEESNLTTQGDLLFYSGSGPTRLPIGKKGQSLVVNAAGTAPEWKYWGEIYNVYYVESQTGVDEPAPVYGSNIDQPWKTIRYAAEEIEKGPLRPNARKLIENNRAYITDETVEWVNAQIAGGTGIWAGFTNDSETTCRRDMGQILDAVVYDITHGGNEKTRAAALTYFDGGSLIAAIADEDEQLVAAINYMSTVIDAVISNLAPAVTYGSITRYSDASLEEESDAQGLIEGLLAIITDAVTAGTDAGIPAERIPNNTIFVKTGLYNEVLPIRIPQKTAVVGDELRSARIEPAGQLVDSADTPYTLAAVEHLIPFINEVITGADDIGKSASNLENYVDTSPVLGDSTSASEASDLMRQIYDYIDWGVNGVTGDSTEPKMQGSNTPRTSTEYTYAVEAIEKNRTFLVEEVIAYIADTYPAYSYNEDRCRRDVNRYLDAVQYDLIAGGNYNSLMAAKFYVNAVTGSLTEDMFYLRNATGLRNCTVAGLTGTLGNENEFGTKRPTAGAYCSLDPGWGPDDQRVWITTRSPYVQNVTTFGTACIGMKVDGDLHNGGNDSIVANDFTQVISDGIGAWVTNLGRAELVSVFSYYAHIGYLAENGGKIRATNGNSSYGTFGTVAEGVDNTEIPNIGTVTNQAFEAIVDNVFTDGDDILIFEYLNAGVNYTAEGTSFVITGEGFGASIDNPTVKNGSVFEVRLLDTDLDADSTPDTGGSGYLTNENVAQSGDTTTITLSNTDNATSGQYTGMSIFIISGTGAGQYGYINSYNSGTKVAEIYKHSDGTAGWDHVSNASIEAQLDETTTYRVEPRVIFSAPEGGGGYANTAKGRVYVEDETITKFTIWDPGQGYTSAPTVTLIDPNNIIDVPYEVRIGDGVLAQPTWTDRGTGFTTASVEVTGDGYADLYQPGGFLRVENLTEEPIAGSTLTLDSLSDRYFKLVVVRDLEQDIGTGLYSAQLQISPDLTISEAPEHAEGLELRLRFSQVRLTGHDFLSVGTGNFQNTNYPGLPLIEPDEEKETQESGGGRVFYTSTDQDGNFRVGDLFSVEQSTGVATLNADAFNISGLQELSLGELSLGGTGATVTEFSADGTFTANSDNIVPTQKAIKTYITSQIGGGAGTLNVNSITIGQIFITGQEISTTSGTQINVEQKMNFLDGVDGVPVAMNYFLSS
jgi:hypothetical protein